MTPVLDIHSAVQVFPARKLVARCSVEWPERMLCKNTVTESWTARPVLRWCV